MIRTGCQFTKLQRVFGRGLGLLHEIRNLCRADPRAALSEIKARQRLSIQQIGEALAASGMSALDEKARALGLSRSTAWTVLKGGHKATGLTASVVSRILAAPHLPTEVRAEVARYVDEKLAGSYGHTVKQRRRFASRVALVLGAVG